MKLLCFIPARGGSKGIPGKNIKPLAGKPLIHYTIDTAREIVNDESICVSTDDDGIIKTAEDYGLKISFRRPAKLSTDTAGSYEVLLHGVDYYEKLGCHFDALVLLQPTSPLRTGRHVKEAMEMYSDDIDMVVSVKESKANPYYNLFEETKDGFLALSKKGNYSRRQDAPAAYEYNGAIYIINIKSLKRQSLSKFYKVRKYVMDDLHSLDLDTQSDWDFAEFLIEKNILKKQ